MLVQENTEMIWDNANKKIYTSLGYTFTGNGDHFIARVVDLPKGCRSEIIFSCDFTGCERQNKVAINNYMRSKTFLEFGFGRYYCKNCVSKVFRWKKHDDFVQQIERLTGNEYSLMDKYRGDKIKITMSHNLCGHKYKVVPYAFINGRRCPNCFGKEKKTTDEFKDELYKLTNNEYILVSEYNGAHTLVTLLHDVCNLTYKVKPSNFINGRRCPRCSNLFRRSHEEFVSEIFQLIGCEYTVIGEFKSVHTKIEFVHNKCNRSFDVMPSNFLRGTRCPNCISSSGENVVESILISKSINFKRQHRIKECRLIRELPFDFAIFNNIHEMILLIEYDGIQHFEPRAGFGGEREFLEIQKRDSIKTKYCEENNIKLLRIPYFYKENIESILNEII